MGKEIIVSNCWFCPFVNDDGEYGKTYCQLNNDIIANQLPADKVHDDCPLKDGEVTVKWQKK